jgi:hypothetical protein
MIDAMTQPRTPRLRTAILVSALAVVGYMAFWFATTQVKVVRAAVPFGEDPYDLFASVAIVLLPLVGGLTAIRVARYGPSAIPAGPVATRVRLGLGICLALVSAALGAVAISLGAEPTTDDAVLFGVLVGAAVVGVVTVVAWLALAASRGRDAVIPDTAIEPDAIDDLVVLLPIPGTARTRLTVAADLLRRHRALVGLGGSLAAAAAAVIWHAVREGAWATPAAAAVYGGLLAAILLVAYGLTVGPLRVLRSA